MRRLAGASVVAMLVAASPARADDATTLETAKAAVDGSDYLTARAQLTELTNHGNNGPDDMAEIYRLSGIIAGALGEAKPATEAFERCLALTPKATLPPGTSPKIAKPFAAAQAYFKTHEPLKIKAETTTIPPSLTIAIVSDPLSMIASASVLATVDKKPPQHFDRPAAPAITIPLSPGGRIDLRVIALDAHGNRLAEVGSLEVPLVIVGSGPVEGAGTPPPPPPKKKHEVVHVPAKSRPLYLTWWLWGGTSIALAAGATYFAFGAASAADDLDTLNAHSVEHTFDEARAIEDRGQRDALLTNIFYGAAGTFAVVATILYLTSPHSHDEERVTTTTITPVPIRGGGAVVLGVPF
jgi:hypothetical protein